MKRIRMSELSKDSSMRKSIIRGILSGDVFLYPTDTLYGLGCDATNPRASGIIRNIKNSQNPFSVIAPSKEWIKDNLVVTRPEYLERLPGPYTLIFRMKSSVVCREVAENMLGVRIPDHPFTGIVQEAGTPFVTTSANISGETPAWNTHGVPAYIEKKMNMVIDDGIIKNPPSRVIDLTGKKPRIIR